MRLTPTPPKNSRIGFHYFPDTLHYCESDLHTWLPEFQAMGASWLVLQAPSERAIPEDFLRSLLAANIEPVLHFHLPLDKGLEAGNLQLLFENYARWGVHYIILFDRPNTRGAWPASNWAQSDLVERFLDIYLPAAELLAKAGLYPVLPPLEPGGDYWDTAFLRATLNGLKRRGSPAILDRLVLSAYGHASNRPLNWGAGGPERWPGARPYTTPPGSQDQRGLRIFDWYLTLAQAELGQTRPILLLEAGSTLGARLDPELPEIDRTAHTARNLQIAQAMRENGNQANNPAAKAPPSEVETLESIPAEVIGCNFWLLAAESDSPFASQAWYQPDGATLPAVAAFRQWISRQTRNPAYSKDWYGKGLVDRQPLENTAVPAQEHPIAHYLLLPLYEWGIAEWQLDIIRNFVRKFHPTIGYSLEEARLAERVTIIADPLVFTAEAILKLGAAGCTVEQITGDGTSIATQLDNL
jgi:hypothetical protein